MFPIKHFHFVFGNIARAIFDCIFQALRVSSLPMPMPMPMFMTIPTPMPMSIRTRIRLVCFMVCGKVEYFLISFDKNGN